MIVAGEASGDMHGAKLAEALRSDHGRPALYGIGGERMRAAGVEIVVDANRLAVVGITEVFVRLPQILEGMRRAKALILARRPDLLILIDFPDFNLHLAAFAKKHAVPVLYYVSPTVWAWRQGRIRKIKRCVDHMAVILPFEAPLYRRRGIPVTFVGHPIMDQYPAPPAGAIRPGDSQVTTIGLLPGSRDSEVARLLPLMLAAAERIGRRRKVRFLMSQAPSVSPDLVDRLRTAAGTPVPVFQGPMDQLLRQADLVVVASGTCTLEAAIHTTPMVIVYQVSPLSYRLGKALIRVPHIGLVNLIAGRRVVPELIQHEASPAALADQVLALLDDPDRLARMRAALIEVTRRLGNAGAAHKVAAIARDLLAGRDRDARGLPDGLKESHEA